jgi:hypothetical protein
MRSPAPVSSLVHHLVAFAASVVVISLTIVSRQLSGADCSIVVGAGRAKQTTQPDVELRLPLVLPVLPEFGMLEPVYLPFVAPTDRELVAQKKPCVNCVIA